MAEVIHCEILWKWFQELFASSLETQQDYIKNTTQLAKEQWGSVASFGSYIIQKWKAHRVAQDSSNYGDPLLVHHLLKTRSGCICLCSTLYIQCRNYTTLLVFFINMLQLIN